jgi:hypothetical protein
MLVFNVDFENRHNYLRSGPIYITVGLLILNNFFFSSKIPTAAMIIQYRDGAGENLLHAPDSRFTHNLH